jgi:iron complex outermembrane recepter protein
MKLTQSYYYLLPLSLIFSLTTANLVIAGEKRDRSNLLSTSAIDLLAQQQKEEKTENQTSHLIAQGITRVTGVEVKQTPRGLELILVTAAGSGRLVPLILPEGNDLVIDILDATLAFSIRNGVEELNPAEGINKITVNKVDQNSIRVRISGQTQAPSAEVVPGRNNLVLSINPQGATAQQTPDEEIEVIATGEAEEEGYNVTDTNAGTRTDTPLRDIPQSIQIVPEQVLEEQQVNTLNEAVKNVPGATQTAPNYIPGFAGFTIRGFSVGDFGPNVTKNGLSTRLPAGTTAIFSNVERVEILRGPASVLFGDGDPGGTVNIITKKPLRDPFYSVEATIGSYDFYGGAIDLTGPLNDSKTALYRINASYESADSFVDFSELETPAFAGVLEFELGKNTNLNFDLEYSKINQSYPSGLPAVGTVLPNPNGEIPRDRNFSSEDTEYSPEVLRVGYDLEHRFSENWKLRNAFYFSYLYQKIRGVGVRSLDSDLRTLQRGGDDRDSKEYIFDLFTNVVGKFSTGAIDHQLLFGVDLRKYNSSGETLRIFQGTPIDIFNPVYNSQKLNIIERPEDDETSIDSIGIYLQDQVALAENFKLLIGGRFDFFDQTDEDLIADTETSQSGDAFSPRLGVVYQPIEPISLYASYTRSFSPTIGESVDNEPFEPSRGTQYEVGVKADLSDNLSATLALYDLTRTNVSTADPNNPDFEIQTGEQNSQGVELFVSGEILPGWNVIAGYAYTDAKITEDNTFPVGNSINNVAENSFNLWTSYQLQQGSLQGLGFGVGFFVIGDRQGDLDNSFTLPDYFRTDAAIFYNRDRFRASLNFNNLFDEEYFESAYSDLSVYPGESFTVQGTVSYEF